MSQRAILFANGELSNPETIRSFIRADDVIICADGGFRHALALDLTPDLVIGDLDSISPDDLDALQQCGCRIEQHPVDKDATDLELALLAAERLGIEEVILVAALGGRLDQSLGNLMLMASPRFTDLRLNLIDGHQTARIVRDQITITGHVGDTVSALALSPVIEGLTYHHGLRWPLQDFTLPFGSTRGISNELIEEQAHISLRNGILLVIHTTSPNHTEIIDSLRLAYDNSAMQRDSAEVEPWKIAERDHFLNFCLREGKKTLLEIGAGPGHTSRYFQDNGLEVVCIDLSPSMIALCRKKGLTAHTMDVLALDFPPNSFDAVFAFNSLLHIPKRHLPQVLDNIRSALKPDGLFYLGVYGGYDSERIWEDDPLEPKRFFSFHSDDQIQQAVSDAFDILQFKRIPFPESDTPLHFQSLVLRRR